MRKTTLTSLVMVSLLIVPPGVFAQDLPSDRCLTRETREMSDRVVAEGVKLPTALWQPQEAEARLAAAAAQQQGQPQGSTESWASRHPVLLGMFIGMGAGAAISASTCSPSSNCDMNRPQAAALGAAVMGGFGALAGWIVSVVRR